MNRRNRARGWIAVWAAGGLWAPMAMVACGGPSDSGTSATFTGGATTGGTAGNGAASGGLSTGGLTSGGAPMGGALTGGTAAGGAPMGGAATGGAPSTGGALTGGGGTGGVAMGGAGSGGGATGGANTGGAVAGGAATGGAATGGAATGGAATGGAATGGAATGGAATGGVGGETGGAATGGAATGGAGSGTGGGGTDGPCTVGSWPAGDPKQAGPYETTTEAGVGPAQSDGTRFTLVRPSDLEATALCHPIVTWGNGSGSNVTFYTGVLEHLASHGFIVIASESGDVQKGNPYYQIAGALWVVEQGEDESSPMYQRVDGDHIGATGHSKGGFATSEVGTDSRITTTAPACGAIGSSSMKGPTLILCGGQDPYVECGNEPTGAYNGTSGVPTMLANSHGADHGNWFSGGSVSDMTVAITAWMRVHLMDDTSLRGWFYGASCTLCQDSNWTVQRKMMDQ